MRKILLLIALSVFLLTHCGSPKKPKSYELLDNPVVVMKTADYVVMYQPLKDNKVESVLVNEEVGEAFLKLITYSVKINDDAKKQLVSAITESINKCAYFAIAFLRENIIFKGNKYVFPGKEFSISGILLFNKISNKQVTGITVDKDGKITNQYN